jgi:hypothetical protein
LPLATIESLAEETDQNLINTSLTLDQYLIKLEFQQASSGSGCSDRSERVALLEVVHPIKLKAQSAACATMLPEQLAHHAAPPPQSIE